MTEAESRKAPRDPPMHHNYSDYPDNDYSLPLIPNYDMSFHMPDFTRPPPGFPLIDLPSAASSANADPPQFLSASHQQKPQQQQEQAFIAAPPPRPERPSIPYWRLPAAVMVAHLKLAQYEYAPIDANAIQLPQLRPPSKRLIDVTNTFYQPPSHDRPRDTEGWEKLALHEFYKAKEKAKNGEIADDFINSLHEKQTAEDDFQENAPMGDRLMDTDYRHMEISDMVEFRTASFGEHKSHQSSSDYGYHQQQHHGHHGHHHHSQQSSHHHQQQHHHSQQYDNCSPRMANQRSLLGSPWEEFRHQPFGGGGNSQEMAPARSMVGGGYGAGGRMNASLLGGAPRHHMPQKVTPLMSLDVANSFKRQHANARTKRNAYSRNSDDGNGYNERNRGRRRYSSRSRSPYDDNNKSLSRSRSRSRSRSSRYSRSRSRTYSRSRSRASRSRSRSSRSRSSRSSDKRPYKGGFIARKSRSRWVDCGDDWRWL